MQPISLKGVVEKGHGFGKKFGAPTANFDVGIARTAGLEPGLYLCTVRFADARYEGMLYFGINSRTNEDCLEVYLRHFSGELVGRELAVTTMRFIREPLFFKSLGELQAQIQKDLHNVGWVD